MVNSSYSKDKWATGNKSNEIFRYKLAHKNNKNIENEMKQKPIIIWWGVNTSVKGFEEGIRAEEPIPILKKFLIEYAGNDRGSQMMSRCPAILDELQNIYGIKPYYDYNLNIDMPPILLRKNYLRYDQTVSHKPFSARALSID